MLIPWKATGKHCTQAGAKGKTSEYFSKDTLMFCVHTSIGSGGYVMRLAANKNVSISRFMFSKRLSTAPATVPSAGLLVEICASKASSRASVETNNAAPSVTHFCNTSSTAKPRVWTLCAGSAMWSLRAMSDWRILFCTAVYGTCVKILPTCWKNSLKNPVCTISKAQCCVRLEMQPEIFTHCSTCASLAVLAPAAETVALSALNITVNAAPKCSVDSFSKGKWYCKIRYCSICTPLFCGFHARMWFSVRTVMFCTARMSSLEIGFITSLPLSAVDFLALLSAGSNTSSKGLYT
mmetsp:Transcript_16240/g.28537  ORF Transcript_16240/g.28537 Transcript_16240/m.28537 type:complete len:294 (+) Transcript_16240:1834-2715(+)